MIGSNGKELENLRLPCLFTSRFEEEKVKTYLANTAGSRFVEHRPLQCFSFACAVLGDAVMLGFMEDLCPNLLEGPEFLGRLEDDEWGKHLPRSTLVKILKRGVYPHLSEGKNSHKDAEQCELERRLASLREAFKMTDAEIKILTFRYLLGACPALSAHCYTSQDIADFSSTRIFSAHGHTILGLPRSDFLAALNGERLIRARLFQPPTDMVYLTSWAEQYLSGLGNADLSFEFFRKENDETLAPSDFDLSKEEIEILGSLLQDTRGHNLLFYGTPGTGKTSLARSLAKACGKEIYTVKMPESAIPTERLQGVYATLNLACAEASIVLIDEADELLNVASSERFESKVSKSWINTLLESHGQKIIWITNRSDGIDPSTMRRFSFAIEFSRFNDERRLKVMHHELKKLGLEHLFSDGTLRHLCRTHCVNADGIVKATSLAALHAARGPEAALNAMKATLKNHERATSGHAAARGKRRDFRAYSLEGLNTSQDLGQIVAILEAYLQRRNEVLAGCGPMALLLYGAPGTGKTEFVYYLGERLKKDVLLKRSSDILSKYVGETEQNMAKAFAEAQAMGEILFFDEADTFLFPRAQAERSWEKSFTNEILAQLQDHEGIVVFATNMIEGLDHAALRRFRFKIEFQPLTAGGKVLFYAMLLAPLVSEPGPDTEEVALLASIPDLTPGDFAVVREQHLYADPSRVSHGSLIRSLAHESSYKSGSRKRIWLRRTG